MLLETEHPAIGDLRGLIDEQVPRIGAMPMRSPQETGVGHE